jgi:hypothetical protein
MANPFSGIITSEFKSLFVNMIDSLLENDALTVPCRLVYEATKFTLCTNCTFSPISGRSTNKYKSGGPAFFLVGSCPLCHGVGRIPDEQTEIVYMAVLWNPKEWIGNLPTNSSENMIQTISKIDTLDQIRRANEILVDTDIEKYQKFVFKRSGESTVCGLGASSYVFSFWERNR